MSSGLKVSGSELKDFSFKVSSFGVFGGRAVGEDPPDLHAPNMEPEAYRAGSCVSVAIRPEHSRSEKIWNVFCSHQHFEALASSNSYHKSVTHPHSHSRPSQRRVSITRWNQQDDLVGDGTNRMILSVGLITILVVAVGVSGFH